MNLTVADSVQVFGMPAAFGFGYQMMGIALVLGNFSLTQWADQISLTDLRPSLLQQAFDVTHAVWMIHPDGLFLHFKLPRIRHGFKTQFQARLRKSQISQA